MKPAPFDNCQFQSCDLPGQCASEGQCHHPDTKDQQAVIDSLRTQLADATRKLEEARKDSERLKFLTRNPFVMWTGYAEQWSFTIETKDKHRHAYSAIDQAIKQGKGGDA
jgi:hypothetical protein